MSITSTCDIGASKTHTKPLLDVVDKGVSENYGYLILGSLL